MPVKVANDGLPSCKAGLNSVRKNYSLLPHVWGRGGGDGSFYPPSDLSASVFGLVAGINAHLDSVAWTG